jgi:hypothetical protein
MGRGRRKTWSGAGLDQIGPVNWSTIYQRRDEIFEKKKGVSLHTRLKISRTKRGPMKITLPRLGRDQ